MSNGVKQLITYYKDYSIKTYTEYLDGIETLFKRYNKKGVVIHLRYATGEWGSWKYNKEGVLSEWKNHNGRFLKRRFHPDGRLAYEKSDDGVYYDWTLNK